MKAGEREVRRRSRAWLIVCCGALLLYAAAFVALKTPAVSNALGGVILPEVERATGMKFGMAKVQVNLIPLFVEVRDLKGFDGAGKQFFAARKLKAYMSLSGLLQRELLIRRIVGTGVDVNTEKDHIDLVIRNVRAYLAEETDSPIKAVVKSVELRDSALALSGAGGVASVRKLNGAATLGTGPRFYVSSGEISLTRPEKPDISLNVKAEAQLREDRIEIGDLTLYDQGSSIRGSGSLDAGGLAGELLTDVRLLMESLKRSLGLKSSGEGMIEAKGKVVITGPLRTSQDVSLALKLQGDFFLESLMETLDVREDLAGWLSVQGAVEGPLTNLRGTGSAKLRDGRLYGVSVDRLQCRVDYSDGTMSFSKGEGSLYGGTAEAQASIPLPVVDHFTLNVRAKGISSAAVFGLIAWDPGIPEGKVDAELSSSGADFRPRAAFHYRSSRKGTNVLGRVADVSGTFELKDGVITFPELNVDTLASRLSASGRVDLGEKTLSFSGKGSSTDLNDFSAPYFEALRGPASFSVSLSGSAQDPLLEATVTSEGLSLLTGPLDLQRVLREGTVSLSRCRTRMSYRKNLLVVESFDTDIPGGAFGASGTVAFERADHLFDVRYPEYKLTGNLRTRDLGYVAAFFRKTPTVAGRGNADLALRGKPRDLAFSGLIQATDLRAGDWFMCDQVRGKFVLTEERLDLQGVRVTKGTSGLTADAKFFMDGRYSFSSSAARLDVGDVASEGLANLSGARLLRSLVLEDVRAQGEGTLESPSLEGTAKLNGQNGKLRALGKGDVRVTLQEGRVKVAAALFDEKATLSGEASLTEELPWTVSLRLQPGRYDQVLSAALPEVPEDLILSLRGTIVAQGDRHHVTGKATFDNAHVNVYGIGFSNTAPIVLRMADRQIFVDSLGLRNETSEFTAGGTLNLGKSYNLNFEGTSSLSLFKFLSKNVELLKGNSAFSISVSGDWAKPQFGGAIDVTDGAVGLRTLPYRLTAIKAYLYFDGDRLVLEQATGRVSGGAVSVSGTASLRGLELSKFSVDARVEDVTATISKDLLVNFDGNVIYKGTREAQTLLGELNVKKARYSEKMDFPSLILKTRQRERPKGEVTKLDETKLNVRVLAPHVVVNNNLARATLSVDLLVKGTVGQPIPFGKVEAKEGIIYFMGNEYNLTKARVDFADPNHINPYFDVSGETKVSNYSIRLALSGFADRFNLSLTSTPALSESDIFSLLTVGYAGARPTQTEGGASLTGAGAFLAGQLTSTMEDRLKTVSGLDRIQVDTYTTRTGTVEPRVSVAKRLWGDKLYVSYGTTLRSATDTGTIQVWKVEYVLTKNISLVGTRDELGGVGADLKFRFEFR